SSICATLSCFVFQAEDGIRDATVTGVQTCALPICLQALLRADAQRDVSTHVAISTKQSLKTSEGCTDIGPSRIQRRAPETVRPRDRKSVVEGKSGGAGGGRRSKTGSTGSGGEWDAA